MEIQNLNREQVNEALEEKLSRLKAANEREEVRTLAGELNSILYSAILHHAPAANAVQIQTNADVSRECRDLPDWGYRARWKDYVQLALDQEELTGEIPFVFTAHLPFAFTTGTHGSGERAAMGASIENMAFAPVGYGRYAPAQFRLDIGGGVWLFRRECYFLPQEVESVKLAQVEDSEFSLLYKERGTPLEPSPSALEHYLFFKGFGKHFIGSEEIPGGKWKERIVSLTRDIFVPNPRTGLLRSDLDTNELSGFAALTNEEGRVKVYEFSRVPLPCSVRGYRFMDIAVYAAHAIDLHQSCPPQENINVYESNDAITRLHEFKTDRRFM